MPKEAPIQSNSTTAASRPAQDEIKQSVDSILTIVDTTLVRLQQRIAAEPLTTPGVPVEPNEMFREIFTFSKRLYDETGGAPDMAGPLFNASGLRFHL